MATGGKARRVRVLRGKALNYIINVMRDTTFTTGKPLPFALKAPNAETRAAMAEADAIVQKRSARFATATELFDDLEKTAAINALLCRRYRLG
jgi:hypothetical protein